MSRPLDGRIRETALPEIGSGADLDQRIDAALPQFGLAKFRPGQREAIETLLREGRLLYVAATGGGKSLIYQLPATLLRGTTLVISPLISLMIDQVDSLERKGIPATFLASSLAPDELRRRLRGLADARYKLTFITPERLTSPRFRDILRDIDRPLVAVDEAHCISEWGHDFRPEYLRIGESLADLPPDRLLACTASATPRVRAEIIQRLGLDPATPQILRGFARPNLSLDVRKVRNHRGKERLVNRALRQALGPRRSGRDGTALARGTAIVYAATRRAVEAEAQRLSQSRWSCRAYHAGLSPEERASVQGAFTAGELEIVVATNAFGMGIDRPDVRLVIHLAPPGSIESYYQEVGRAGRSGDEARGLLLLCPADIETRRRMVTGPGPLLAFAAPPATSPDSRISSDSQTWPDSRTSPNARILPGSRTPPNSRILPDSKTAPDTAARRKRLFDDLLAWARARRCRHDALLVYFGDAASGTGCGKCDICRAWPRRMGAVRRIRELIGRSARRG